MNWRILLVDDDPYMRALITAYLTDYATTVVEFEAAEPALAELLANPYDLLITDLNMPGARCGRWLVNQAREHLADLPIIVITGDPLERRELRAADAIILKPFHPDELLGEIWDLLPERGTGKHRVRS